LPFKERFAQAWKRLRGGTLSPGRAALSIGVGVFVGCLPVYGLQFLVVAAICMPLRLDTALAYLAAHISNPLTVLPMLALEVAVGSLIFTGQFAVPNFAELKAGPGDALENAAMGSVIVGSALASIGGGIAWTLGQRVRDSRRAELARGRSLTIARYAEAPESARHYVAGKLRMDPSVADIVSLEGSFGRVVDAGCGFGHVGLALIDLERATAVHGFDADPGRVDVARRAAPTELFEVARLEDAAIPEADTVLFVDSLHYLPIATQDAALARAVRAIPEGGRIVIREVDANRSMQSRLTQWSERRAVRRVNPDVTPGFRSREGLVRALEALGLTSTVVLNEDFSIFENVLVVGTKPKAVKLDE
jgi:uncharacterized protein (DUF2062 family)/2-polyprenyl-3-methyl-5-hydroxy-6-metoxy-1,4-benzoquinol methylase